jgi:CRP-like cAMP-binding protein
VIENFDLSLCPLCSVIPQDRIHDFFLGINLKVNQFSKGDTIARQGDMCKHLYILVKGSVKTEMVTESGGLLTVEVIKAPKPLASAFLFAENNTFPVDVTATEDSIVLMINRDDVIELFRKDAKFMERYLKYNSNKTQFLSNKLQILTIKTIRGKLAHYLLEQLSLCHSASPSINTFEMDKNQTELAKYFGVSRPALARTFSELQQEKIISADRNRVTVLKIQALRNLIL